MFVAAVLPAWFNSPWFREQRAEGSLPTGVNKGREGSQGGRREQSRAAKAGQREGRGQQHNERGDGSHTQEGIPLPEGSITKGMVLQYIEVTHRRVPKSLS